MLDVSSIGRGSNKGGGLLVTSISKWMKFFVDEKLHLYHDLQMHVCDSISCIIVYNISWMCLYVITKLGTNSIRSRSYLGSLYTIMVRDHDHANAKSLKKKPHLKTIPQKFGNYFRVGPSCEV